MDCANGQLELVYSVDCSGASELDQLTRLRRPVAIAAACLSIECPIAAAASGNNQTELLIHSASVSSAHRFATMYLAYVIDVGDSKNPVLSLLRYK